ncbi:MAG TPA: hypothetical protein VGY66_09390, partial [Gemmataceae bacterium]|nr:hypothetical protein [Gemmataceae bacterium]
MAENAARIGRRLSGTPGGNVEHVEAHDLTTDEVDYVLENYESTMTLGIIPVEFRPRLQPSSSMPPLTPQEVLPLVCSVSTRLAKATA